jgi:hypothetical protein
MLAPTPLDRVLPLFRLRSDGFGAP